LKKHTKLFLEFLQITIGIAVVALGLNLFLIPNKLAAGGASGLATILFYSYGLPVGISIAFINIILFSAGTAVFGRSFGVKTAYGAFGLALAVELSSFLKPVTSDPFLATLYGGVLSGIGMGIVFRNGANTGGTDILAQIINRYSDLALGQLFLIIDATVTLLAWKVFGAKLALYGLIAVFIMGRVIDLVLEGVTVEKAAIIISEKHDEIAEEIKVQLNRGATILQAKGAYSGEDRPTILCVVSRRELEALKELVHTIDPKAFTIINDAREVTGEGFRLY
jgi:uncharacterized membrane-anchored protein YitT (DUF2179 family)